MTIEEMIKAMTGHLVDLREAAPHVITALRRLERLEKAGQAMRDAQIMGVQGDIYAAVKAWDAATASPIDQHTTLSQEIAKDLSEEF